MTEADPVRSRIEAFVSAASLPVGEGELSLLVDVCRPLADQSLALDALGDLPEPAADLLHPEPAADCECGSRA